jgi:hypothetical protein
VALPSPSHTAECWYCSTKIVARGCVVPPARRAAPHLRVRPDVPARVQPVPVLELEVLFGEHRAIPPASAKADARGARAMGVGRRRAGGVELDPCAQISAQ